MLINSLTRLFGAKAPAAPEGGANAGPLAGAGLRPDGGKRAPDGRENKDQKSSFTSSLTW